MSKSKSSSKSAKAAKSDKSDVLTKVKDAAIAKPAQTIRAKSKDLAKQIVGKEGKRDKKSKKVKEPTPEPSESSEAEDSESSESSSSDSESEVETKPTVVKGKSNGVAKPAAKKESSDESESDSGSESEAEAPKANGVAKMVEALSSKVKQAVSHSDSESASDADSGSDSDESDGPAAEAESSEDESSDNDSDESSEDEKPVENGAVKAAKTTGIAKIDTASESSDDSDDSEESDQEEEVAPKPVKRKAEEENSTIAKKPKSDAAGAAQSANLFVGNLSWNVDEAWLTEVFEEFGELAGVRIVTERDTGRSKGFGYVEFVKPDDAARAHSAKAGAELDGRAMNVDFANARPDNSQKQENRRKSYGDQLGEPSDTLFLGNLSFDVGQEAVTESFAPHGTILGIRLPTDRETGQPKGFGYVTFTSVDEAKIALEAMQGAYIEGRPLRIDYSSPRPQNSDSPARGRGGFGGRGGARGGRGGRGGNMSRGGFGGRGGGRGGRGASTNRGGFGDFSGKKTSFD